MADNFDLRQFLTENKLTKNAKLLKEADETRRAYALVIDEDGNFIQEDLSYYSEESYLDPEGEELSGVQEVLTYPETVSAWQHAPELKDSQDAEWKQAVAKLGDSYAYYDVIGDSGENAVIAAIPQGSSLTDYIQDEDDLEEAAPESMQNKVDEGRYSDSYDSPASKQVGIQLQSAIRSVNTRAEIDPTIVKLIAAAEEKTGTQVTSHEKRVLSSQGYHVYNNNIEMEREGVEEGIHDYIDGVLKRPMSNPAIEPLEQSPEQLSKDADTRSERMLRMRYRDQIQNPNISNEELEFMLTGKGVKGFGGTPNAVNNILTSRSGTKDLKEFSPYGSMAFSGEKPKENEKAPLSSLQVGDLVYVKGVSHDYVVVKDIKGDGTVGVGHPHNKFISYQDGNKEAEVIKRAGLKEVKIPENSKKVLQIEVGDILGSGEEVVEKTKEDGGMIKLTLRKNNKKRIQSYSPGNTMIMQKQKETVKENKMTQRDKYITRLVENALGVIKNPLDIDYSEKPYNQKEFEDEYSTQIDQAMYRGLEEGDEIADKTVIPEYNDIEELMKEINKTSNIAANERKVVEMKKIAEALRAEAQRMEESEHAKHINPKVRKKYLGDAIKIEKAAEKLVATLEKETKNDKPASAPKAEKVEALQETTMENFDLKKFLIENKLTRNSRMLSEAIIDLSDTAVQLLMDKTKYATKPGSDKGVYVVYDLSIPKGKGSFGDDDDSTQKVGVWWTKDSAYKANKFESDHQETINKLK